MFCANDRCDQENLLAQLHGGVRALQAPVDNLESNWAYMVMTALAWNLKAWWALLLPEAPGRWQEQHRAEKRWVLGLEFKTFVNAFVRLPCQIVRTGRRLVYRLLSWNPHQPIFFRLVDRAAVLTRTASKSESGCSDPPRPQERPRRKSGKPCVNHNRTQTVRSRWDGAGVVRTNETGQPAPPDHGLSLV